MTNKGDGRGCSSVFKNLLTRFTGKSHDAGGASHNSMHGLQTGSTNASSNHRANNATVSSSMNNQHPQASPPQTHGAGGNQPGAGGHNQGGGNQGGGHNQGGGNQGGGHNQGGGNQGSGNQGGGNQGGGNQGGGNQNRPPAPFQPSGNAVRPMQQDLANQLKIMQNDHPHLNTDASLGNDPAHDGAYNMKEHLEAMKVQAMLNTRLRRDSVGNVEWRDDQNNKYDLMGPVSGQHLGSVKQWRKFQGSIDHHASKAHHVPFNLANMSPEQITTIKQQVAGLPAGSGQFHFYGENTEQAIR